MTRYQRTVRKLALVVSFVCVHARAQDTQFLPEVDAHVKLNSRFRAYLEAKDDRDGGETDQFGIGPSLQFYLKPLIKLKSVTAFDLDDSKARFLVLETGYRSITAPNAPTDSRMLVMATLNLPMNAGFHLADRNRADLDWKNGSFTWRYRNKLSVQRTFAIGTHHLIPYVAAESYYTSQYNKWSTTALYAGCLFPMGKHFAFNSYYEHENNTGKRPNRSKNAIGLSLYLYFSLPVEEMKHQSVPKNPP
jgi:hypothetical protein